MLSKNIKIWNFKIIIKTLHVHTLSRFLELQFIRLDLVTVQYIECRFIDDLTMDLLVIIRKSMNYSKTRILTKIKDILLAYLHPKKSTTHKF